MPLPENPPRRPDSPFAPMRGHHTGIRYPDFADALSFWVDQMDWRVLQTWPYGDLTLAYVMPPDRDDFHLEILAGPGATAQPEFADIDASLGVTGLNHVCLEVDSVDDTVAELRRRGVDVVGEPFEIEDISARLAFFRDPWGTMFELSERIGGDRAVAARATDRDRVTAAFDEWAAGTGGPFALLAADAVWTIVGTSPVSRTYGSRDEFIDAVIDPFNARMSAPLVPAVRHVFADGDWVIALFDAEATALDGVPYRNTYTWHMRFADRDGGRQAVEVIAFFDTIEFTDFWNRVEPARPS